MVYVIFSVRNFRFLKSVLGKTMVLEKNIIVHIYATSNEPFDFISLMKSGTYTFSKRNNI